MSEHPAPDVHAPLIDGAAGPVMEPPGDPFDGPAWDAPPRRKHVSRRRRRRRRHIRIALLAAGGIAVLGAAWLVVTGLMARNQLIQARADVHRLRAEIATGDLGAARATAAQLAKHAHRAHVLTTGPAWALAAGVPLAGAPMHTGRGIT